jgi:zinc transport system ATP-binding protein
MSDQDAWAQWDIEIDDLHFAYDRTAIFSNDRLYIRPAQFACVVGPNGGGKTTLLKLLLGLLEPGAGTIRVLGRPPRQARADIGYVPQHARMDSQFPVSVMDVALMGRLGKTRRLGPYRRDDRRAVAQALDQVGLAGLIGRQFSELSGGQQQRVLIARCLSARPRLLLLDEPTANLDAKAERELLGLLQQLSRDLTVLLVTHDVGFVSELVNTVICVNHNIGVHPTAALTGEAITDLYDQDVRLVRHGHNCISEGCSESDHD